MTRLITAMLLVIFSAFAPAAALADEVLPLPGARVAGVELDYPAKLPEGVAGLVDIKPGDAYSARKVRESIKLLYLKGVFQSIGVEGVDTPGGVRIIFHLVPKVRVSGIDVDGSDQVSKKKIIAKLTLKEGDFIEGPELSKSRMSVLKLYEDEGFRKADVAVVTSKVDELRADLVVRVTEGPPAVISDVSITGETALPVGELYKKIKLDLGGVLRKEDLDKSVAALTDLFVEKNYVNAKVDQPVIRYNGDRASVEFHVSAGARLDVSFEGNESVSDGKLRKALIFWEDRDATPEGVSENLGKLRGYYSREGYYFAVVNSRTEQSVSPPRISVRFIIYEGPRGELDKIVFNGNKGIKREEMLEVMSLQESSFFRARHITDEAVAEDVERLHALYESRGYLKADVSARDIGFSRDGRSATLVIDITEGTRTYVTGVEFSGNHGICTSELTAAIRQKEGQPFNPAQLRDDKNNLLNIYSQRGCVHALIDVDENYTVDKKGVTLNFKVSEGVPTRIGRLIVAGLENTHENVLLRELLVKQGDVFDYEKVLRSQQRIYKLGFFSKVNIQPVEPDKPEPVKDLLISVKERDAGAVDFGGGYGEFDRFRGFAEVSYRNLFGYGHRISLRGELSEKSVKTILNYKWPWFLGLPLDFRSSLVYLDAQKVNYHIRDLIAASGFDKTFGEKVASSVFYQYERLKLGNVEPGAVLAPEDKNRSNIASITPSVIIDFRDNPFNPTKGSVHGVILKWASTYLGSTVDFLKATAQTSWYFPVYDGIIFAASARGGIEGWFGGKLEIPISERFFLGGASNLRGYKLDSVAPRGKNNEPAGGDSMALFNLETRFPLPYGFGIVTFLDAGNVWLINKNVEAGSVPQNGLNGLRYGTGVGLRYETPVGPLRLDYGIKLNRITGESGSEIHFTLGQAF